MLTLTEGATEAIQSLMGDRPGAGLRIYSQHTDGSELQLGLSISDAPEPNDQVVEQSGCQVFLEDQLAPLLDGRTLDAHPGEGRRIEFSLVT